MRNKAVSNGGGAPAWMTTFADMMSLLLTFFVLLLSFATMDIAKFNDAMGSINEALGFMPPGNRIFQDTASNTGFEKPMADPMGRPSKETIVEDLEQLIDKKSLQEDFKVEETARGVILRVRGKMFFSPGTSELKPESYPLLEKISGLMKKFDRKVAIEGHTDNIPLNGGKYSSNWELSTARAYSVLKVLQEMGDVDTGRINIAGYGSIRPIAPNDSPEGRSKNRRVEFIFKKE